MVMWGKGEDETKGRARLITTIKYCLPGFPDLCQQAAIKDDSHPYSCSLSPCLR